MPEALYARIVPAEDQACFLTQDPDINFPMLTAKDLPDRLRMPSPLQNVPLLAEVSEYTGEPLAIVCGKSWYDIDHFVHDMEQHYQNKEIDTETLYTTHTISNGNKGINTTEEQQGITNQYRTEAYQELDTPPLWVEISQTAKRVTVTTAAPWPELVQIGVSSVLKCKTDSINITTLPARDSMLIPSVQLAMLAALAMKHSRHSILLSLTTQDWMLYGRQMPTTIQWQSRFDTAKKIYSSKIELQTECGAYPALQQELFARCDIALRSLYHKQSIHADIHVSYTPLSPTGLHEGLISSQIAFAREIQMNRIAEHMQINPIQYRLNHLDDAYAEASEICSILAKKADFYRRYSANQLVRKKQTGAIHDNTIMKGIGFALSDQCCNMQTNKTKNTITVRIPSTEKAELISTAPISSSSLIRSLQRIAAEELEIEPSAVRFIHSDKNKTTHIGNSLFSCGVSFIPQTVRAAARAIKKHLAKQKPPIHVQRTVSNTNVRSIGAATVEIAFIPITMSVEIRSIMLMINAGEIIDEASARQVIYQNVQKIISWCLPNTTQSPKIHIDFFMPQQNTSSRGIAELPFAVIPAALTSAIAQASGYYLSSIPYNPRTILSRFQETVSSS